MQQPERGKRAKAIIESDQQPKVETVQGGVPFNSHVSKVTANFGQEGGRSNPDPLVNVPLIINGLPFQPPANQQYQNLAVPPSNNQGSAGVIQNQGIGYQQAPQNQPQSGLALFQNSNQYLAQSNQVPQNGYLQQSGTVPASDKGIFSSFNTQAGPFGLPLPYGGQNFSSSYQNQSLYPQQNLPRKRLIEDRLVYEDEFVRVSSFMAKPLVEVEGKLQLRVHVMTVNKTQMPINYFVQKYFGPKSRLLVSRYQDHGQRVRIDQDQPHELSLGQPSHRFESRTDSQVAAFGQFPRVQQASHL